MKPKRVEEAEQYVVFLEKQRDAERAVVEEAGEREASLHRWIAEREASIAQMRAELDALPARVILAQSRLSGLGTRLSTARKFLEDARRTTSLQKQLQRAKDELEKLTRKPL